MRCSRSCCAFDPPSPDLAAAAGSVDRKNVAPDSLGLRGLPLAGATRVVAPFRLPNLQSRFVGWPTLAAIRLRERVGRESTAELSKHPRRIPRGERDPLLPFEPLHFQGQISDRNGRSVRCFEDGYLTTP